MANYLIIPLLLFYTIQAAGQEAKQKIRFSSVNEAGLLSGGRGEAFTVQTINGIKKDKWFAGIGAGLDLYEDRTVPLFFDYRRSLSNSKNIPFVYADIGINFLWLNFIQKEQKGFPSSSPGFYYDVGLGWKLAGKNSRGFILSAGYSLKEVKEKVRSTSIAPTPQLESENYDRYKFLCRRLVIKVGFQL